MGYIDGFNLFFGLRDSKLRRYYWLNPEKLVANLLKEGQVLVGTRYFTARISPNPADPNKHLRQQAYLEALETLPEVDIVFGQYLTKPKSCLRCHATWQQNEEKMTDVNIAVRLLTDAMDNAFDTAMIVSADSDLVPPVQVVRQRFPQKRIIIASPPKRHSVRLAEAANACFTIGRKRLADSQLPDTIVNPAGYALQRPDTWK
ncbi:NYN domain-containing protein [Denitratimonas sp. CY0512]|uniref:NYN domain-containing protein n=1 Tax=Denitratimonas sp. CY0512 TaxID=3131940 RepID=UPI0030B33AAA